MIGVGLECLTKWDTHEVRYLARLSVKDPCHRGPPSEADVLPDVFRGGLEEEAVQKVAGSRLADRSLFDDERWVGCGFGNYVRQ